MRLLGWQLRWEQVAFWRNPQAAFFTFAFPLMFLVVFASLNRTSHADELGGIPYNQYLVPAILTFGLTSACYSNLAMGLTERRETGMLKRLRATPLPSWALVGGMILNSVVVAVLLAAITVVVGIAAYDIHAPYHPLPVLLALVLGAVTFCALGIGLSTLVRNTEAAPAVVQFPYFLLNFISGVFFPAPQTGLMHAAAQWFPVVHLVDLCFAGFDPRPGAGAVDATDVLVLLVWAVAAVVVAVRGFRWEPRR
jgi:ABC-2 type transport system permease protein